MVLARNPNYWLTDDEGNRLPYLDEIVHVIVGDLEAELDKFLAGESDSHGVLGEEYAQLEPLQEEGNFTIHRRGPGFGDLVSQLTGSYDWEAMIIGFTGGSDPYSSISFWHSSEALHLWHPNQPQPATEWEAEIDELYVMGSQELDRDVRVGHYQRAQEVAAENVPVIYTTLSERLTATRNVFGNVTPTLYALWDIRYLYRTDT